MSEGSDQAANELQGVVDCYLARNSGLALDVHEMAYCPLVPKATVTGTQTGLAMAIPTARRWLKNTRGVSGKLAAHESVART
jgi:hypothetical protein